MKQFNDFKSAFAHSKEVLNKSCTIAKELISEQIYKDSNAYTYRDSGDMYKSGEIHSEFTEGIIEERTPYVRRRYYEGGKAGAGNPNAKPKWFEEIVSEHKNDYQEQFNKAIELAKKG